MKVVQCGFSLSNIPIQFILQSDSFYLFIIVNFISKICNKIILIIVTSQTLEIALSSQSFLVNNHWVIFLNNNSFINRILNTVNTMDITSMGMIEISNLCFYKVLFTNNWDTHTSSHHVLLLLLLMSAWISKAWMPLKSYWLCCIIMIKKSIWDDRLPPHLSHVSM